jgi:lambda repressor-like predicted transcriptional regulator
MTYAKRVDANQKQIVAALRKCGVFVADTSRLGGGHPDIICQVFGRWVPVELKMPGAKLTDDEVRWWHNMGMTPIVAHDLAEALAIARLT